MYKRKKEKEKLEKSEKEKHKRKRYEPQASFIITYTHFWVNAGMLHFCSLLEADYGFLGKEQVMAVLMMIIIEVMKEKEEVFLCPLSYYCIVYFQNFRK